LSARDDLASRLHLHPVLATRVLTSFIADAVTVSATAGVVVGLSGGVDSALAAALAAAALGPERVHPLLMPYRESNPESAAHARQVAVHLGLTLRTIEITPMIDSYFEALGEVDTARRGNKMARERMAILYDQAKKHDCLVLGTSNKTELLLGYSTVFGDNASSLNPLGDLYKTQVWQLSEHLDLPAAVVRKPPSADLWPGQTDEKDFGFDYHTADQVLYLMFDQGFSAAEIVEQGFDVRTVERIVELEKKNRFKRRLMLIARLSGSAVNLDREIPRD
jgi:NAD+ synthase